MAQVPEYPTKLFFFCEVEPAIGGETPIVLSHVVYERMKDKYPDFVDKLEKHGVIYTRVLGEEDDPSSPIGRGWKSTFLTTHKSVAEERSCLKMELLSSWTCQRKNGNFVIAKYKSQVAQHFKDGYLHKDEFKIVYVAPMKALAAEVTSTFSHRLAPLNVTLRELTGDMQLSKNELEETQMIVTTPEKWDVITRKSSDMALSMLAKLLIIDEVHLLNDDRGPVIEALVARTLRQVEFTQSMIRIVGLSATLPNYLEVAQFLRVNPDAGLFFFDSSYRPVPLDFVVDCGIINPTSTL